MYYNGKEEFMKKINKNLLEKFENSKKEVLKRVAKNIKEQQKDSGAASHQSHSSGSGRTHSSYVSN